MTEPVDPFLRASLIVAHDDGHPYSAVVPPIVQTSLFTFADTADMRATYRGEKVRPVYSRVTNPTVHLFEAKIAASVLAFVQPGDRIVCVRHCYPDAYRLFETLLKKWQVTTTYVDGTDLEAVAAALPGARVLYLESPTSWTMEALDVRALAALARAHGAISIIDNSWATPVFQQPIALGVDLTLHSASKYIGGHSDVVAGVVAGRRELIDVIRSTISPYLGAKLAPFDAWLLIRGLRTLPTRMKAHEAAGLAIARRLAAHPKVVKVHHPGLGNQLPPGLSGTSSLLSFQVDDSIDVARFCDRLRLFQLGVSWGGHESLVVPAIVTLEQNAGPNSAVDFGVPPSMVRLHVGLEGADALWTDIEEAIGGASRG